VADALASVDLCHHRSAIVLVVERDYTWGMGWQEYIEQDPDVMMGKPVFKGTRLTVEHVLRELSTGMSEPDLLAGYPRLRSEHVRAAQAYAAAVLATEEVLFA
jgi:uncharacterized protein (DUF433 family)